MGKDKRDETGCGEVIQSYQTLSLIILKLAC